RRRARKALLLDVRARASGRGGGRRGEEQERDEAWEAKEGGGMTRPPAALAHAEMERREHLREAMRRAVLAAYIVDKADAEGPGRFLVRRLDVYHAVAETLKVPVLNRGFCVETRSVAVGLGAIPVWVGKRA